MKKSKREIGLSLEEKVANLYEALRFDVKRNINISGHQIDLVVSKYFSGVGSLSCMVEVKSRTKNLGINEIANFITAATQLIQEGKVQNAICVTDASFTQDARSALLRKPSIRFLTLRELEKDLFNFGQSLVEWCRQYEGTRIFREYVPLEGQLVSKTKVLDIVAYIGDWLRIKKDLLIISGDFGSGKTTIAERTLYNQAQHYLNNNDAPFPLLLPLRLLRRYQHIFDFIQASLQKIFNIAIAQSHFETQLRSGRFILLLDGFDEIDTGANAIDRARYMDQLSYVIGHGSPCVLTTRPTYFDSFNEFSSVLRLKWTSKSKKRYSPFDRVEIAKRLGISLHYEFPIKELANAIAINALGRETIEAYLRARSDEILEKTGYSYETVANFVFTVYDLEDLVQRPLLLDMVVRTIIHGSIDLSQKNLEFGPSELYDFYTLACAQRDVDKDGVTPFLCAEDRLDACRQLAVLMFNSGTIVLTNEQILAALKGIKFRTPIPTGLSQAEFVERAATDIRVCSFLTRDEDNSLKFSHTSFTEFFFAQQIVQECKSSLEFMREQTQKASGIAVTYFLGSFARSHERFSDQIKFALESISDSNAVPGRDDRNFNELVLRIAWASSELLKNKHLKRCVISNSRLAKSHLTGTYLDRAELRNLILKDSILDNCVLTKCSLSEITMSKMTFDACKLDIAVREFSMSESTFRAGRFSVENALKLNAVELRKMHSRDWLLQRCVFNSTKAKLSGKGLIIDTRFLNHCSLSFDAGTYLEDTSSVSVQNSTVFGARMGGSSDLKGPQASWLSENGSALFSGCELVGLWMSIVEIIRILEDKNPNIILHDCHGIVLTEDRQMALNGQRLAALSRKLPHIAFLDLSRLGRLGQIKEDLRLSAKDCNLRTLCTRLAELRSSALDGEVTWSFARVQEVATAFQINLDKVIDVADGIKRLAISNRS